MTKMTTTLLLAIPAALLLAQTPPAGSAKPAAAAKPAREPGLYATIAVTHGNRPLGNIVFQLYEKESPITVKNFTDLAMGRKPWVHPGTGQEMKTPLYNGLTFHRVIPDFMIQGGDPTGTGMGGTKEIPDEFHPTLKFDGPGRVAMANAGPATGSCQFFITEAPAPHLTGRHTIFGRVVEGQALVAQIARVPRGANDKPAEPVKMAKVTIQRVGAAATPRPAAAKPAGAKPAAAKPASPKPAASKTGAAKTGSGAPAKAAPKAPAAAK
jgi:cyclophilin family peptidyl-prolyl cis-trans isomerase